MTVTITETISNEYGFDDTRGYSVETPLNRMKLFNLNECPEDATLSRDLGCIFRIPNIIREAYEASLIALNRTIKIATSLASSSTLIFSFLDRYTDQESAMA